MDVHATTETTAPIEPLNPSTYAPGATDLFYLIGESPRGEPVAGFWEGRATARELAAVLWPLVDLDERLVADAPGSARGLTPVEWLTAVLDFEATPCVAGGSGRLHKRGDDYVVLNYERDLLASADDPPAVTQQRPYGLPHWPGN